MSLFYSSSYVTLVTWNIVLMSNLIITLKFKELICFFLLLSWFFNQIKTCSNLLIIWIFLIIIFRRTWKVQNIFAFTFCVWPMIYCNIRIIKINYFSLITNFCLYYYITIFHYFEYLTQYYTYSYIKLYLWYMI